MAGRKRKTVSRSTNQRVDSSQPPSPRKTARSGVPQSPLRAFFNSNGNGAPYPIRVTTTKGESTNPFTPTPENECAFGDFPESEGNK